MANELHSLSDLFQNRLFRIPDYQRGYAWKHEQLADFWADLLNLHEDKYHYTGLLSLNAVTRHDIETWKDDAWLLETGYKPFHIVDGQQRLTTASILMHEVTSFTKRLDGNRDRRDDEIYLCHESLKDITSKYIMRRRPPHNLVTTYLLGYEAGNPNANCLRHRIFDEPHGETALETYYTKNLQYAKEFFSGSIGSLHQREGLRNYLETQWANRST